MTPAKSKWRPQDWRAERAERAAVSPESREDDVFDAVVSAAALTARADGVVREVERLTLLDYLDRQGLLWPRDPEEALTRFERRLRDIPAQVETSRVFRRLRRHRDSRAAALILGVCDEVAAADGLIDPREDRFLRLVRADFDVAGNAR
jgi:tellurite resistance protein